MPAMTPQEHADRAKNAPHPIEGVRHALLAVYGQLAILTEHLTNPPRTVEMDTPGDPPGTPERPPAKDHDPAVWCRHPRCPDTNWGGTDRVHLRDPHCPPDGGWVALGDTRDRQSQSAGVTRG